jgi:hypothetical protein
VSGSVVIGGALAQKPFQAGHSWQFLQYLLGFRKLGWNVLFLDRLDAGMCVDQAGRPVPGDRSDNAGYFVSVLDAFGLKGAYSLALDGNGGRIGMSREAVLEHCSSADFLLNVMGYITDEETLAAVPRRVFLDTDPGFGQMWEDLGLADLLSGHDDFVTIAENIHEPGCAIPDCGRDWIPWRQPIVLDEWPVATSAPERGFTSIGSWRGPYAPVEHDGRTYGLRVHEFRKFMELPRRVEEPFEVALDIHAAETADLERLHETGWRLVDPAVVARDPWAYRSYIQESRAEFMATKGIYVHTGSGWFSERSICYLASGRPVLVQDTRLGDLYPIGEGLVAYSTLEDAIEGACAITADYDRHARAAREIAEVHFASEVVLPRLLDALEARS